MTPDQLDAIRKELAPFADSEDENLEPFGKGKLAFSARMDLSDDEMLWMCEALACVPDLRLLDLCFTLQLSDTGLLHAALLTQLATLKLTPDPAGRTKLTPSGITALKACLPRCVFEV